MTDSSIVKIPDEKEAIILVCPPGLIAPQGFPLKIRTTSAELDVVDLLGNLLAVIMEGEPCVVEVPGAAISLVTMVARMADVEIRAILGFEGEYPSQWRASAATLPTAIVAEIMAAAGESSSTGGDGIPEKKKHKDEMKPADIGGIERRLASLKASEVASKLGVKDGTTEIQDQADIAQED